MLEDGHIKRIALEMRISDKYLYAIMGGSATDPFPVFERLFTGVASAYPGREQIYLRALEQIARRERDNSRQRPEPLNHLVTDLQETCAKVVKVWGDSLGKELPADDIGKLLTQVMDKAQEIKWSLEIEGQAEDLRAVAETAGAGG